jgi:hypothetical protein
VFTFRKETESEIIEVDVPIHRRSLYLISRASRFQWKHGIKAEHIKGRRIVCTLRELSQEFNQSDNVVGNQLKLIAKNYI